MSRSAREALLELQREKLAAEDAAFEAQQRADAALIEADKARREAAAVKRRAAEAIEQAEREERLAEAREQAEEVSEEVELLTARFTKAAEGLPWYEGTGEDDRILSHQWIGCMFGAVAKRWLLGDQMGLGKTRVAIGWLDLIKATRVIVVTEPNLCDNFSGEVMTYAPHRTLTNINGIKPKAKKTAYERRHDLLDIAVSKAEGVIVVNYELFRHDKDALAKLLGWQAEAIIVDEAHNIKSKRTANYKYVEALVTIDNVCGRCGGLIKGLWDPTILREQKRKVPRPCSTCGWKYGDDTRVVTKNKLNAKLLTRSAKHVLFMTGTPLLNEPGDIFPLLHLIDPLMFRTEREFRTTFCTKNYHSDKWEFRNGAMKHLKPLIEGRFLARTLSDAGVQLPEHRIHVVPVDLNRVEYPKQYRTIRQISEAAQIILDSGQQMTIMHLIALITRKRQANVWPGGIQMVHPETGEVIFTAAEIDESVKMDVALDNIVSLMPRRQIVFSQFKTALAEFEQRLSSEGLRVARFDGDTPKDLREEIRRDFKRGDHEYRWDVVLANYKTGGSGLNLTAATAIHILDEEWNPGKRNQSYARAWRMGQTEEVDTFVYRIPGSIDTWMSNTIARKQRILDGFEGAFREDEGELTVESFKTALEGGML